MDRQVKINFIVFFIFAIGFFCNTAYATVISLPPASYELSEPDNCYMPSPGNYVGSYSSTYGYCYIYVPLANLSRGNLRNVVIHYYHNDSGCLLQASLRYQAFDGTSSGTLDNTAETGTTGFNSLALSASYAGIQRATGYWVELITSGDRCYIYGVEATSVP